MKNAQMGESPLILIGGAAANLTKGRGALQVGICNQKAYSNPHIGRRSYVSFEINL